MRHGYFKSLKLQSLKSLKLDEEAVKASKSNHKFVVEDRMLYILYLIVMGVYSNQVFHLNIKENFCLFFIDSCAIMNGGCAHSCMTSEDASQYYCICYQGYVLTTDGKSCTGMIYATAVIIKEL